jgi:antitoxin ParD1/3/4
VLQRADNNDMAVRTTLNVSLTPELDQFVQDRVASGRYQTASEVVREGLRLLEIQEQDRQTRFNALKARLEAGVAQAGRGELHDPRELLKEIRAMKKRRAASKA